MTTQTQRSGKRTANRAETRDRAEKRTAKRTRRSQRAPGPAGKFAPADLAGSRPGRLPTSPSLELATAVQRPPNGAEWLHEIKFDGYRLAAVLDRRDDRPKVRLLTRNGLDWTGRFPKIADAVASLPAATAVLDGEVVALGAGGRSDFGALQRWLGGSNGFEASGAANGTANGAASGAGNGTATRAANGAHRIVYQAFDLLYLDGHDLKNVAIEDRKSTLSRLLATEPSSELRFTEHLEVAGRDVFEAACDLELEGVVSKRLGSKYRPGRQRDWLKTSCLAAGDFVIGGFTAGRGSRQGFGALLLGEPDDDGRLTYVGKVGTGFDDQLLRSLGDHLRSAVVDGSPFSGPVPRAAVSTGVTWVEPKLVAEIAYAERTKDGYLRQPRFRGLRPDKEITMTPATTRATTRATTKTPKTTTKTSKTKTKTKTTRGRSGNDNGNGNDIGDHADLNLAGVRLSNPDRVLYPDQGVTKRDLARYYLDVGEHLLRYAAERPLSLVRCPEGSEQQCFYQKHPGPSFASGLPRVQIEEKDGVDDYLYLQKPADIVALVQAGVLEVHAWGSTVHDLERPDLLVFDLDPSPGVQFNYTKRVARQLRDLLAKIGLTGFLKATGGKGLHVVVPLEPEADWETSKAFAKGVAEALAATDPARLTTNMSKSKRVGKVFIDYLRNARGATAIVPYSTRSRLGAPVALPLRWDELARLAAPDAYDVDSIRRRLTSLKADPWADFERSRRPLSAVLEGWKSL